MSVGRSDSVKDKVFPVYACMRPFVFDQSFREVDVPDDTEASWCGNKNDSNGLPARDLAPKSKLYVAEEPLDVPLMTFPVA